MKRSQVRTEISWEEARRHEQYKLIWEEARRHEQYKLIPEHILHDLFQFVHEGLMPGHFLRAVLNNDLFEAVGRADKEATSCLSLLVIFIHNRVPSVCYQINGKHGQRALDRWCRWCQDGTEDIDVNQE